MVQNSLRVNETAERAKQQAGVQLASIEELVTCLEHAESCDNPACGGDLPHDVEEARAAIIDDALTVEVRTDWHSVALYQHSCHQGQSSRAPP